MKGCLGAYQKNKIIMTTKKLRQIFDRTNGHCHFCGDKLVFEKYGLRKDENETWEADHIIQKGKGGSHNPDNRLSACYRCNRLRWNRKGKNIRNLLLLGLIAKDEIEHKSELGKAIVKLKNKRQNANKKRRRNLSKVF